MPVVKWHPVISIYERVQQTIERRNINLLNTYAMLGVRKVSGVLWNVR